MKIVMKCLILLLFFFISVSPSYAKEISLATGFKGGTYYSMGMDLKDIWQKVGINTHVLESKGAWQNLLDILDDKVDFAFTQFDAYVLANVQFKNKTGKHLSDYVKVVSILHPEEIHILSAGKIKEFKELNGARVGCGPKNSGSCITAQFLSYAFNINMNLVNASYEDSLEMLKKGNIDALIMTVGKPAKLLANLSGYNLISIPSNDNLRFLNRATIEPKDYNWLKNSVITYSIPSLLVVKYKDNPEHKKLVGALELSILANKTYLQRYGHDKWKDVKFMSFYTDTAHPISLEIIKTCGFYEKFGYSCDGMKPIGF